VEDVVRIFNEINKAIPAKLIMVGDGPERPKAEELCRELNLCDEIRFVGKQVEMEDILPIGDLFLLTSEYESFGLAALEAMAAQVPVVCTNAGGLPEIMIDGENGYMSNVGDVDGMSKKAISILTDDAVLKKFKAGAMKQASRFDIQNIVPQYETIYSRFVK
jgi:L-malate glycosyltransferase